jgi:hypothetical protein
VNHVEVIQGGVDPKFTFATLGLYLFYRKRSRGKIVAQAAAEHLRNIGTWRKKSVYY